MNTRMAVSEAELTRREDRWQKMMQQEADLIRVMKNYGDSIGTQDNRFVTNFENVIKAIDEEDYELVSFLNPGDRDYEEKTDGTAGILKFQTVEDFVLYIDDVFLFNMFKMSFEECMPLKSIHSEMTRILKAVVGKDYKRHMQRCRFRHNEEPHLKEVYGESLRAYRYTLPKSFLELYISKRIIAGDTELEDIQLPSR
jgi:hypothetical protein